MYVTQNGHSMYHALKIFWWILQKELEEKPSHLEK